jgi:UDP-glucose 4-epimerase
MKAIVTGGAGFIGSHLVKKLINLGWQVTVIDNFSTGNLENIEGLDCQIIEEDVNNISIQDWQIKHNALFHLAAPVSVEESLNNPKKYYDQILRGTANIVDWSLQQGNRDVIIASTAAIYGDSEDLPYVESGSIDPISPYAKAKHMTELLLKEEYEKRPFKGTALRFFNVYGEGQRNEGGYLSAVPVFLNQYESFEPITVTGDGKQTRDFIYVGDVVEACISAYTDISENGIQVMNVASGQETSIMDLAEAFGGEIIHIPERLEPKRSVADITKIKSTLSWKPLTRLLTWVKQIK